MLYTCMMSGHAGIDVGLYEAIPTCTTNILEYFEININYHAHCICLFTTCQAVNQCHNMFYLVYIYTKAG